jgi:hypothetical protein
MALNRPGTARTAGVEPPDEKTPAPPHLGREGALVGLLLLRVRREVVGGLDLAVQPLVRRLLSADGPGAGPGAERSSQPLGGSRG